MIRVVLIGAGLLGRRHLVSLAAMGEPVTIVVRDPSQQALDASREAFASAGFPSGSALETRRGRGNDDVADVAIVATNAHERLAALEGALAQRPRAVLLEKVLFTRMADYDRAAALLAASDASAFVNCVRRTYDSFAHLTSLVAGRPFLYRVAGEGWGLACNAVHHLDEFAALAGTTAIEVDASGLTPGYIPAKREGYVELLGTLRASAPNGSTFEAVCGAGTPGDRQVTIETSSASAVVSQQAATLAIRSRGECRRIPVEIPLQSQITANHVRALLAGRAPALPDYEAAAAVHRPMITAFLEHLRRTRPEESFDECPIT